MDVSEHCEMTYRKETSLNFSVLAKLHIIEDWKQKGSNCSWIKKQIEPFRMHPSESMTQAKHS